MKTTTPDTTATVPQGWVLYDGTCPFCTGSVRRLAAFLRRGGFAPAPLQAAWVGERLGLPSGRIPDEMLVLTVDGRVLGGMDGIIHILGQVWWTSPVSLMAAVPGLHKLLQIGYRHLSLHRHCLGGACRVPRQRHRGTASFFELP